MEREACKRAEKKRAPSEWSLETSPFRIRRLYVASREIHAFLTTPALRSPTDVENIHSLTGLPAAT